MQSWQRLRKNCKPIEEFFMGRNATPKLNEWRDGSFYEIVATPDCFHPEKKIEISPECGAQIVYRRRYYSGKEVKDEVLAVFWADSFAECIASAFASGYSKGVKKGKEDKLREIKSVLEM
jgi:hypothetical protein